MDWTALLVAEDENPRSRLVTELLASDAYGSMEARAAAFVRQGGGCRATFFNYRSERVIRCRFIFSGKNGELTPDFCAQVLVHFPKGEVLAAKQHGEPVLLGPAIDGPCPGRDHSLGVGEDDEVLALQGIEPVDHPLFDHCRRLSIARR